MTRNNYSPISSIEQTADIIYILVDDESWQLHRHVEINQSSKQAIIRGSDWIKKKMYTYGMQNTN